VALFLGAVLVWRRIQCVCTGWDGMGEYRKGDRSFGGSPFFVFGIVCLRLL